MNEERDQTFFINEPSEFFKELSDKNSDVEFEVIGKNDNEFILMTKKNVTIKKSNIVKKFVHNFSRELYLRTFNLISHFSKFIYVRLSVR